MNLNLIGVVVAITSILIIGRRRVLERKVEIAERTMLDFDLRIMRQLESAESQNAARQSARERVVHIYVDRVPERLALGEWGFNWMFTSVILVVVWGPGWTKALSGGTWPDVETGALWVFQAFILVRAALNAWHGFRAARLVAEESEDRARDYINSMNARLEAQREG